MVVVQKEFLECWRQKREIDCAGELVVVQIEVLERWRQMREIDCAVELFVVQIEFYGEIIIINEDAFPHCQMIIDIPRLRQIC